MPSRDLLDEARAIIDATLVWDNHACMPLRPADRSFLPRLADVRAAGVDIVSLNIGFGEQSADEHLAMLGSFTRWIEARADDYLLVRTTADVAAARTSGRLGILFDVEGMYPLNGGRIDLIERFRRGGVGWMLIAYNRANEAGGGCADADDGGLTAFGRQVLAEMRRVGMIACCSHTGHRTAREVMAEAGNPVILSHSNAAALHAHYRNIPDDLIRDCARTGGVVGINGLGHFLGPAGTATAARVADHIDHIAQLVGAAHVAIGLDYVFDRQELIDYFRSMRAAFPDADDIPDTLDMVHASALAEIAAQLLARGFGRADLGAILGGNWLRVAGQVWGEPSS